jgi:hypothetical protein
MNAAVLRKFTFGPVNLWSLGPYKQVHHPATDHVPKARKMDDEKRREYVAVNRKIDELTSDDNCYFN